VSEPWSDADLLVLFSGARASWPNLNLPLEDFAAFVAERFPSPGEVPRDTVPDLFLACACARNIPGALQAFRERHFPVVLLAVRQFDDSEAFAEEVFQRLSDSLFVSLVPGQGKIIRYQGQGALAGFVATAARRIALRLSTTTARFHGEAELVHQFSQFDEQETSLLKLRYRDTFNRALAVALRNLPRRERLVLRMNLVEKVSTTQIAALYRVSQPTVSRWIQRSAKSIFAAVKNLVCDELAIDTRELESLLLLVRSQIEITISHATGNSSFST
jgi:RNA polymerase sigma-70 factor (ECF subfamily)